MKLVLILCLSLVTIGDYNVNCELGCSFSDEDLCGYTNLYNGSNGPIWLRQQFIAQSDFGHNNGRETMEKPPKGDYYMYTGPTQSTHLAEKTSQLKSPTILVNNTGKCLYFTYHNRLPVSLTPSLVVMKKDQNDSESNLDEEETVLVEFYSTNSPKWFEVQVPLPEGEYSLVFEGKNYNRTMRGGQVAITNIAIKDDSCAKTVPEWLESPGDCGFEGTLDQCGYSYTNDSSPVKLLQIYAESLSAAEQSQRSSRKPPDDRFLAMTSKFYEITNQGNKVRLLSPEISIQREGCVYLWYYNSVQSRNDESNALNIHQLENTREKLLFRLPILKTQRDKWYQLNGALPRGTYRLILEVVYTSDYAENDYVGFDNIEIFSKSCSDVRLMPDVCEADLGAEQHICHNESTCVSTGKKSYRCVCKDGYYGNRCEHKYPCTGGSEEFCLNGGTCSTDGKVDFRCACPIGFDGKRCENIKTCGSPENAVKQAQVISFTNTTYRSTARFECVDGWVKYGELTATCSAHGEWEVQGKCLQPQCNQLPTLSQLSLASVTNKTLNGRATYKCHAGMTTYENNDFFTCRVPNDVTWRVTGDTVVGRWYSWNNSPWPRDSYYSPQYDYYRGRWVERNDYYAESSLLSCHPIPNCGTPPAVVNGNLTLSNTSMYGVAAYSCFQGYEISENVTSLELNCSQHGQWKTKQDTSVSSVQCYMLPDCGPPPEVANAVVNYTSTTLNSTALYTCNKGYRLIGSDTAACWKVRDNRLIRWIDWLFIPTCEPVCPVRVGRQGNFTTAEFSVSQCKLFGFQTFSTNLSCDPAISFSVKRKQEKKSADDRNDDKIVFHGGELCVSEAITKIKRFDNSVVSNVTRCKSLCLQNQNDIRDIVVYDELISSSFSSSSSSSSSSSEYKTVRNVRILRYANLHLA